MIWIACSGTAGHVHPSYQIAKYLSRQHQKVVWVGAHGMETDIVKDMPIVHLPMRPFRSAGLLNKLRLPLDLLWSFFILLKLLCQQRPKCVCLMGSYVTIPVGLIARLFRIPIWIFEQNTMLGMANKIFQKNSRFIFAGLPLSVHDERCKWINNPVKSGIVEKNAYTPSRPIKLLVTGGSRGALSLNTELPKVLAQLPGKFEIVHVSGRGHLAATQHAYKKSGVAARIEEYVDLSEFYQWADLIICRSGAMTVTECAVCSLPAIFVPYPYATDDHQTENAKYLVDRGGAMLVGYNKHFKADMYKCLESMNAELLYQMHQYLRSVQADVHWYEIDSALRELA